MKELKLHKAVMFKYRDNVTMDVTFADGYVKRYDMSAMFGKYPQLRALEDRDLFVSGKLFSYGIIWNDELDFETESIYENGRTIRKLKPFPNTDIGETVAYARLERNISQAQLAEKADMDQSDISKIERGVYNPSVKTLRKLADALDCKLVVRFEPADRDSSYSPAKSGVEK